MQVDCKKCGVEFIPKKCSCCILEKANKYRSYDKPYIYHEIEDCTDEEELIRCAGRKC